MNIGQSTNCHMLLLTEQTCNMAFSYLYLWFSMFWSGLISKIGAFWGCFEIVMLDVICMVLWPGNEPYSYIIMWFNSSDAMNYLIAHFEGKIDRMSNSPKMPVFPMVSGVGCIWVAVNRSKMNRFWRGHFYSIEKTQGYILVGWTFL